MANSKSRLGRGLGGLITGASTQPVKRVVPPSADKLVKAADAAVASAEPNALGYREIEISQVVANPYQPRRDINSQQVEELARSVQSEGLLQPIVVRPKGQSFELIAGERRFRAFQHLGQTTIPARIIQASDASSAALALIENLQRENLNPIDEAMGYASLVRDFDLTQEAAAERVGKGRATVANSLRLLGLEVELQGFLSRRLISTGHAKVLLGLESEEQRSLLARSIIETGMSVRDAEQRVRRIKAATGVGADAAKRQAAAAEQSAIRDLEKRMGAHFNARVSLKHSAKKGKIMIEYLGNDDLDRILEKLGLASR